MGAIKWSAMRGYPVRTIEDTVIADRPTNHDTAIPSSVRPAQRAVPRRKPIWASCCIPLQASLVSFSDLISDTDVKSDYRERTAAFRFIGATYYLILRLFQRE